MNRTGHKGRTDGNHQDVIDELRKAGITAISLASVGDGCPDVVAGFRGANFLLEVKDGTKPPSARVLTAAEMKFASTWGGMVYVVTSPEDAVICVANGAKVLGLV